METFKSNTYEKNRIVIDIDILTVCNYHCRYCYARGEKNKWNKIMSIDDIKSICTKISTMDKVVDINILGGEPTLHPKLREILKLFHSLRNVEDVTITTNSSPLAVRKLMKVFDELDIRKYPKIRLNLSFHPKEIKDMDEFYYDVKRFYDLGRLDLVTVMVEEGCIQEVNDLMKYAENFPYTLFEQIYPCVDGIVEVQEGTTSDFNKIYLRNDTGPYGYDEVIKKGYNHFKGWKCMINRLAIKVDGTLITNCLPDGKNILRDFKFDEFMICPLEECTESCTLESLKWKE